MWEYLSSPLLTQVTHKHTHTHTHTHTHKHTLTVTVTQTHTRTHARTHAPVHAAHKTPVLLQRRPEARCCFGSGARFVRTRLQGAAKRLERVKFVAEHDLGVGEGEVTCGVTCGVRCGWHGMMQVPCHMSHVARHTSHVTHLGAFICFLAVQPLLDILKHLHIDV